MKGVEKPNLRLAEKCIGSNIIKLSTETNQNDLINIIEVLNKDRNVDGILVQLPLPSHLNQHIINNSINPTKDVDGFTQVNMGRLCMNSALFVPCTAMAVVKIIEQIGIETKGKHALVCSRSKHVGLPIVLMLHSSRFAEGMEGLNMTTTLCHRHTPKEQLKSIAQKADFIISATGLPRMFTSDMIKEEAVVIDVGMTRKCEDSKVTFVGDVDFDDVKQKASFITPVPGGVGPMTVSFLMENTLKAAKVNSDCKN
ncbi:bifunctional methylenetetrahydrofolate dehydrogenase/cyclohydrolase, mitochondrial isoform X2 [Cimex lectularius]|uniref:methenyltetrahydrofolate cyclohydrolase n=1 Tax=Cimex lectularius TaxID=79782 RepID=A0A8I6R6D0_CIMLE|nr:bifunctional methylenetetrahydrofolate dehydrogenase/cyclohydrolase, mitochondrial isoform X2 [Cimex lectularius]